MAREVLLQRSVQPTRRPSTVHDRPATVPYRAEYFSGSTRSLAADSVTQFVGLGRPVLIDEVLA